MSVLESLVAVTRREGLDPLAERLIEIRRWMGDDLAALEQALSGVIEEKPASDRAELAARHLLRRSGKRIRPICVMLGARMGGRELDQDVRDLAIVCELIHAATLLHDDVLDEGTERRGTATSRVVYGNSASILGGDILLLRALGLAQRAPHRHVCALLRQLGGLE